MTHGAWILAPDSFSSPDTQQSLLAMAREPRSTIQLMVLRNNPHAAPELEICEGVLWVEADETERAISRSLRSLIHAGRAQQALTAALQFPAENPNPVLALEPNGTLTYANPAAESLLPTIDNDGQTLLRNLQKQLGHLGEDEPFSTRCEVQLGALTYGFRFETDQQSGRINIYGTDITANLEAQRARHEVERESRNKDVFLTAMSHELRTPLNAVLSCTEAMREGAYGTMNESQLEAVSTIRESGKHLLCLITDILDISKIEAGKLEISTATLGIQAVCDAVTEMVKAQAEAKEIHLCIENEASVSTFQGDPLRIKQILLNLLGNAIKFTPPRGEVGLRVGLGEDLNTIQFKVWDTGPGISSAHGKSIFKPFVQADESSARTQPGTGLGLSIARHLARLHDGDIAIQQFDGPGAIFTVTLPIGEDLNEPAFDFRATGSWNLPPSEPPEEEASSEIQKVLIAEDTDTNYQHLHDMLVSLGYEVNRAVDGQEAIDLCASLRPDLILMDIDMPYVNGLDAIRVIRAQPANANLPIIAVTAMSGVAEEQACLNAGANGFLSKPYPLRDLMMLMQQVSGA